MESKTAGLEFFDQQGKKLFMMDINMDAVTNYGEGVIKGVGVDDILADKISVLSSKRIFRRAKDLVDVYAFSDCTETTTCRLIEIMNRKGRVLDDYDEFINRKSNLEHAYNRLRNVEGKPDFSGVYKQLETFLKPFIEKNCQPLKHGVTTVEFGKR